MIPIMTNRPMRVKCKYQGQDLPLLNLTFDHTTSDLEYVTIFYALFNAPFDDFMNHVKIKMLNFYLLLSGVCCECITLLSSGSNNSIYNTDAGISHLYCGQCSHL